MGLSARLLRERAGRKSFRPTQFGHGRILMFLDHEDPSPQLDQ
jgi:hypothetical protein